ncbi:MAG TPA: 4'-phosphopantetheinyl transferase superfamily protein [Steroidobacteraceae bacterium]
MSPNSHFPPESSTNPLALQGLFPAAVVVRERRIPGDAADLLASEAHYVARAHPKRINEFAAGRACARAALVELGVRDFALHAAADRQPVWPDGFVGSITHTAGLCVAAVAARSSILAIGLDSEIVGAPTLDIWPTICRDEELAWVYSLPLSEQAAAVTLLFSAKEAFYKCQYPLVGEWLDFHDLRILAAWGETRGTFQASATRNIRFAHYVDLPVTGRYVFHEQFISAGLSTPAALMPHQ